MLLFFCLLVFLFFNKRAALVSQQLKQTKLKLKKLKSHCLLQSTFVIKDTEEHKLVSC